MKKLLAICLFLVSIPSLSRAEDIWISQSGGTACGQSTQSAAWFNNSANWGGGAGKIDPGDTVRFCGTVTTDLTVQASGTSGNNIVFDGTNATLNSHFYAGGTNASPGTARQYLRFQNVTFASGRSGSYPCMGFYGSSYLTINNVTAQNANGSYPLDLTLASYVTVDQLNLDGLNGFGIRLNKAHHVTLSRLHIVTATTVGAGQKDVIVSYGGHTITLEKSYIHQRLVGVTSGVDKNDIWETDCQSQNPLCSDGDNPHDLIARYNLFVATSSGTINSNFLIWLSATGNNKSYSNVFVLKGSNISQQWVVWGTAGYNSVLDVYNNTFVAIDNYPVYALNIGNDYGATTVNLKNNIFYNASSSGTAICSRSDKYASCGTGTATINHSHNTWNGFASSSYNTQTCASWTGDGEKCNANPLFYNYTNDDFSLRESSIAMDAGIYLGSEYKQQLKPGSTWPNPTLITPSIMNIGAYGNDTSSTKRPMPPIIAGIN